MLKEYIVWENEKHPRSETHRRFLKENLYVSFVKSLETRQGT